jgi:hypothetical protein
MNGKNYRRSVCLSLSLVIQASWMSFLPAVAKDANAKSDVVAVVASANSKLSKPYNVNAYTNGESASKISADALEVANLMGILPQVERLRQLKGQSSQAPGVIPTDEQMALELYLMEKVFGASLQVRTVADRIDGELAYAYDVRSILTAKRDKNLNYNFIANFGQGSALGSTAGGLFLGNQPLAANICLLTTSGFSILLTLAALKMQSGGKRESDSGTNMLAHFLDLEPGPENSYPDLVWRYLNATPAGSTVSRRQQTLDHWRNARRLNETSTTAKKAVSGMNVSQKESIGLLTDRTFMLHYVHADVEQLDGSLLDLLKYMDLN